MELVKKLVKSLKKDFPNIKEENFQFPSEYGDISCNICFIEGKKRKTNPIKLSEEAQEKIKLPKEFKKVEAMNGYLNFYLDYEHNFKDILKHKIKKIGKEKIMVEFSHPNPCKAMHIGNARTTFLGDSVSEILSSLGHKVLRANYYNDMGKQVAKGMLALEKYGINKKEKIDHELAYIYARLHREKEKKEIDDEAQKILYNLELKNEKRFLWKKIVRYSIRGFNETYKKLGIYFDLNFFESDFREKGKEIAGELLDKKIGFEDDGAIIANLEKEGLPNAVVLKKDGTGLYLTADLALTIHKFKKYGLTKSIWTVSSEQDLYFKQLFKILELLGYKWVSGCVHMGYNVITFEGRKMSSRAGKYILLDDLVDELTEKAKKEVKKRDPNLSEKRIKKIARIIGLGALKYEILKVDRNKTIDFDPNKAISFEGNTGPYLQYMVVRCNSILKKAGKSRKNKIKEINEYEKNLLKKFLEFPVVVEKAGAQLKPNLLCNYAYELSTDYSKFYENCKVIGSEKEKFRLDLVKKTKEVLEKCLNLLGIEVPEKM